MQHSHGRTEHSRLDRRATGRTAKPTPGLSGLTSIIPYGGKTELPILIKLIDAKQNLSVQVHADDEYALKHEHSLGKLELWYNLTAKRDMELFFGFREDMSREQVETAIREKRIEEDLNHIPVHKNEVFFVEAGTVHAVGAGVLLAEIQENTNVTYRLYDYDRTDRRGRKKEPCILTKLLT